MPDYFLRIEGVPGESVDAKHKGEIEVESFSWGVAQPKQQPGGGVIEVARASFEALTVMTPFGKAGPRLFQACASGEHLRSAVLTGRQSGGKGQFEFITLTLSDVLVSSYQSAAASAAVVPSDEVSLSFSKLQIERRTQKADGGAGETTTAGWDVKANQKF